MFFVTNYEILKSINKNYNVLQRVLNQAPVITGNKRQTNTGQFPDVKVISSFPAISFLVVTNLRWKIINIEWILLGKYIIKSMRNINIVLGKLQICKYCGNTDVYSINNCAVIILPKEDLLSTLNLYY